MTEDNEDSSTYDNFKTILDLACRYHKGFKVCYFNARSSNAPKRDYMNYCFNSIALDVLCVVETWFHDQVDDKVVSLTDFKLVRNDRKSGAQTGESGGGVAIYIKKHFLHKIIFKSDVSDPVEYLFVEVSDNTKTCLILCVYNPSASFDLTRFFAAVNRYSSQYEHIILCGDLNIDLIEVNNRSENLMNEITGVGLCVVNQFPTR